MSKPLVKTDGAFGVRMKRVAVRVNTRLTQSAGVSLPIGRVYDSAPHPDPKRLDMREYGSHLADSDGFCQHCGWRTSFAPSRLVCWSNRLPKPDTRSKSANASAALRYDSPAALLRSVRKRQRRWA